VIGRATLWHEARLTKRQQAGGAEQNPPTSRGRLEVDVMELVLADGTVFQKQCLDLPTGARAESSQAFCVRFEPRPILFHGLGFEIGQERRGLARSPAHFRSYFRELRELGLAITDYGILEVSIGEEPVKVFSEEQLSALDWSLYCYGFAKTSRLLELRQPVLTWGGDHTIAVSTIGAFCSRFPEGYVLWVDAHADLNLPQASLSGNVHGMPLSILMDVEGLRQRRFPWLKRSLDPHKLVYLGVRDLDPFEKDLLRSLNIKVFHMAEIRERGMSDIAAEIVRTVGNHPLHVSFDIDSVDPTFAPATGIPTPDGINVEDLKTLGRQVAKACRVTSLDVVEVNPDLGGWEPVEQTFRTAMHFLIALLHPHTENLTEGQPLDTRFSTGPYGYGFPLEEALVDAYVEEGGESG
jgi:arginase